MEGKNLQVVENNGASVIAMLILVVALIGVVYFWARKGNGNGNGNSVEEWTEVARAENMLLKAYQF